MSRGSYLDRRPRGLGLAALAALMALGMAAAGSADARPLGVGALALNELGDVAWVTHGGSVYVHDRLGWRLVDTGAERTFVDVGRRAAVWSKAGSLRAALLR